MLSHGAEGRSSGNLKYPLKPQKPHSLVLTQIIQPGTRSRHSESARHRGKASEGEKKEGRGGIRKKLCEGRRGKAGDTEVAIGKGEGDDLLLFFYYR